MSASLRTRLAIVAMVVVSCLLCISRASAYSTLFNQCSDSACANCSPSLLSLDTCYNTTATIIPSSYRLSCSAQNSSASWTGSVYVGESCQAGVTAFSGLGSDSCVAVPGTGYYFKLDCGTSVVTTPTPTPTPVDCVSRTALAYPSSGCTGTPDVLKGASGSCQALGSYYAKLTCATASSSSAWTVGVWLSAGCGGSSFLSTSGTGTGCSTFNALIATYYLSIDCGIPLQCTESSSAASIPALPSSSAGAVAAPVVSSSADAVVSPVASSTGVAVVPTLAPVDCVSRTALAYTSAGCTGTPDVLHGASGQCQALGSYYATLTCATSSSSSAWVVGVFLSAGCSGSPALSQSGSGTSCTTFNTIVAGNYYLSVDCGLPLQCTESSTGVAVVPTVVPTLPPTLPTLAPVDCVTRTASAYTGAGCTGTPDVLKGASGACQALGSYYATLTCATTTSASTWTVGVFLSAGCSGSPALKQSGSGTSCTTFNTGVTDPYYLSVDCGLPAKCTPEGNVGNSAGSLSPPSSTGLVAASSTGSSSSNNNNNDNGASLLSAALVALPVAALIAMAASKLVV